MFRHLCADVSDQDHPYNLNNSFELRMKKETLKSVSCASKIKRDRRPHLHWLETVHTESSSSFRLDDARRLRLNQLVRDMSIHCFWCSRYVNLEKSHDLRFFYRQHSSPPALTLNWSFLSMRVNKHQTWMKSSQKKNSEMLIIKVSKTLPTQTLMGVIFISVCKGKINRNRL